MKKSIIGQTVELAGNVVTVRKKQSFWHRERCFSFTLASIPKIEAVQVDLFTIEMIALVVHLQDRYYEIYEDAEGYASLLKVLDEKLGSFPDHWYSEVTRTVFEENRILLWKKGAEPD